MIVTIQLESGPRDIEAKVLDDAETLAAHRSFGPGPGWTVSHIPTGLVLVRVDHEGDAIDIGSYLAMFVSRKILRLKDREKVEQRMPKEITAWLSKCQKARKFVPVKEVVRG